MAAKDDTRMSLASLREKLKILQIQSANNQGKGSETPSSRNVLQAASTNATNTPAPTQNVRYIGSEQKASGAQWRNDAGSQRAIRKQQMDCIEAGGNSIHEWKQFLDGERRRGITTSELLQCYLRATTCIPQTSEMARSDHYIRLWLDYAKLQQTVSPDDARDTYAYMRAERLGIAHPGFYIESAALEFKLGNYDKCRQILEKGRGRVSDASVIDETLDSFFDASGVPKAGAKDIAASHVAVSQPSSTVKPSLRRLSPTDTVAQTPIPEETPLPATSRSRTSDPEPIPRKSGLAAAAHDSTARNETTLVTSPRDAALPYPTPSLSASLGDHHQPPAASGAKARPRSESPLAENAQQPMQSASSAPFRKTVAPEEPAQAPAKTPKASVLATPGPTQGGTGIQRPRTMVLPSTKKKLGPPMRVVEQASDEPQEEAEMGQQPDRAPQTYATPSHTHDEFVSQPRKRKSDEPYQGRDAPSQRPGSSDRVLAESAFMSTAAHGHAGEFGRAAALPPTDSMDMSPPSSKGVARAAPADSQQQAPRVLSASASPASAGVAQEDVARSSSRRSARSQSSAPAQTHQQPVQEQQQEQQRHASHAQPHDSGAGAARQDAVAVDSRPVAPSAGAMADSQFKTPLPVSKKSQRAPYHQQAQAASQMEVEEQNPAPVPSPTPPRPRAAAAKAAAQPQPQPQQQQQGLSRDANGVQAYAKPQQQPPMQHAGGVAAGMLHADFVVNGKGYSKLQVLGRGGSSVVYRVVSVDRGDKSIYALKVVRLDGVDQATVDSYISEIELLQRLQGKDHIIGLYDSEVTESHIFIVLECGELDLARMLRKHTGGRLANENCLRLYWQQMLEAVQTIHEQRIIHGDLKPANFLFVEGCIKLIDFGIARAIQNDHTSVYRDSQGIAGTLNYISPEALHASGGACAETGRALVKLGPASDIWSLGCILYAMVYGTTPFNHIQQMLPKVQAIVNPKVAIKFAPLSNKPLLDVLQRCLMRDPTKRPSIKQLLQHEFLYPVPVAQSPSTKVPKSDEEMQRMMEMYLAAKGKTPRTAATLSRSFIDSFQQHARSSQSSDENEASDGPPTPLHR